MSIGTELLSKVEHVGNETHQKQDNRKECSEESSSKRENNKTSPSNALASIGDEAKILPSKFVDAEVGEEANKSSQIGTLRTKIITNASRVNL